MFESMPCSAYQAAEQYAREEAARREKALRDAKLDMTSRAIMQQNELLGSQLIEMRMQNQMLKEQMEQSAKNEVQAKKEAHKSKIFSWVSFAVCTVISIASIVLSLVI